MRAIVKVDSHQRRMRDNCPVRVEDRAICSLLRWLRMIDAARRACKPPIRRTAANGERRHRVRRTFTSLGKLPS